jgi:hypothetical protein
VGDKFWWEARAVSDGDGDKRSTQKGGKVVR